MKRWSGQNYQEIEVETLDALAALDTEPGEPSIVDDIIAKYLETIPAEVAKLNAAVQANEASRAIEYAHAIRSTSANVGANKLSALCMSFEKSIAEDNWAMAKVFLANINQSFGVVQTELSQILPPK